MVNRKLLKQALDELVRLKTSTEDPTRFLGQLYASALEEWSNRLEIEPPRLNKLVMSKETASGYRLH
jgi:hypothetical protein